jgi:hypothetical protein
MFEEVFPEKEGKVSGLERWPDCFEQSIKLVNALFRRFHDWPKELAAA